MNVRTAKQGILVNLVNTTILLVQWGRNAPAITVCPGRAVLAARTVLDCLPPETRITGVLEMIKLPRNGGLEFRFLRSKGKCHNYKGSVKLGKTSVGHDVSWNYIPQGEWTVVTWREGHYTIVIKCSTTNRFRQSLHTSQLAHQVAEAYPSFSSMKRLRIFLLPLG